MAQSGSGVAGGALSEKEAQEIQAKFDRESRTRNFTGIPHYIVTGLLFLFAVYVFGTTLFVPLPEQVRRTTFIALLIFPGYLLFPIKKGSRNARVNYVPWYDIFLGLAGSACFLYYSFNFQDIVRRALMLTQMDIAVAVAGILILFELCRRVVGIPILVVAGGFIAYAFASGNSLRRVIHQLFYTTEGIIGTPIGVVTSFVVLFVFLAAFLEKSGIAHFFIDMANAVTGAFSGGPAKVSVVASAFLAIISGSSVANTVSSGAVTIPVMKKVGYKPHFAAAVEASASTGGQIMPPIMGAAAFLMAEMTGEPYTVIALSALFPAVLYFIGIFLNVHFEAKKLGLMGIPRESLPRFWPLFIAKGYLFLPIVVLIVMMAVGFTPARAAIFGILGAFVLSFFRKDTRFTPARFADAIASGSRNTLSIGMACAVAGCVVGIVSLTGIGQILLSQLTGVIRFPLFLATGTSLHVALVITMLTCLILGMGLPTTANYIIMATITAPMVIRAGELTGITVPLLSAHMFVFYYGLLADVTPPVALASYAASAIARCDPIKAAFKGTQLALTAFIIPYMFVFSPAMLMIDTTAVEMIRIVLTALCGMFAFGAGLVGYMLRPLKLPWRLLSVAAGLLCIDPSPVTDIAGIGVIAAIVAVQVLENKREKAKQTIGSKQ